MLQHLKRKCKPTTLLLVIGFAISLTAVLIGVSAVNSVITSLSEMDSETPIYSTMQNMPVRMITHIAYTCIVIK